MGLILNWKSITSLEGLFEKIGIVQPLDVFAMIGLLFAMKGLKIAVQIQVNKMKIEIFPIREGGKYLDHMLIFCLIIPI